MISGTAATAARYIAPTRGKPRKYGIDVIRRVLSRSDARYESAIFSQVVRHIGGIEDDGHVEIGKKDDRGHIDQEVERHARRELLSDVLQKRHIDHLGNGGGDSDDRSSEDDRNNASGIDPERQMRALAAIYLTSHNTLCIGDRQSSLPSFHKNDERRSRPPSEPSGRAPAAESDLRFGVP